MLQSTRSKSRSQSPDETRSGSPLGVRLLQVGDINRIGWYVLDEQDVPRDTGVVCPHVQRNAEIDTHHGPRRDSLDVQVENVVDKPHEAFTARKDDVEGNRPASDMGKVADHVIASELSPERHTSIYVEKTEDLDAMDDDQVRQMTLERYYEQEDKFVMKKLVSPASQKISVQTPGPHQSKNLDHTLYHTLSEVQYGHQTIAFVPPTITGQHEQHRLPSRHEGATQATINDQLGPVGRSGANKVAVCVDTKGGLKGKKLQAPLGTMMRRKPVSARPDPLGYELNVHAHLVANSVGHHPLLAKKKAAEKAAALEQAAMVEQAAAAAAAAKSKKPWLAQPLYAVRPATAHCRQKSPSSSSRDAIRPASAMARMAFAEHDSRMAAISQQLVESTFDMREGHFVKNGEEPLKQRRVSAAGPKYIQSGLLDISTRIMLPTTDYGGGKTDLVRMGAEVHSRKHACTEMPPKILTVRAAELSRTMDARLEAMIQWAEGATDSAAADAKLTDWFGKWLKSYEYEQNNFRSAQLYGEVKMSEIQNSSSLNRIERPNRFRAAVVCDMFGRIMPIFGRYKGLMMQIRREMMEAIYPNFKEDISVFEQVPCFAENAILLREVTDLKNERSRLANDLAEQEERIVDLQRKVREFRDEITSVKLDAAWERTKQNQLEVTLLSQNSGGDEMVELRFQHNKMKQDLQTEQLLRQAAQDKINTMRGEMDMLKIRIKTTEEEWKDATKTIHGLRQELDIAQARIQSLSGGAAVASQNVAGATNLTVVDWVNKTLGASKDKPFLKDLSKDLSDCRIYLQLVDIIWGADEDVKRGILVAKSKRASNQLADDVAEILGKQLTCKLLDGEKLLSSNAFVHTQMLLELMCTYEMLNTANRGPNQSSSETLISAAMRRNGIAETINYVHDLDVKCTEQMKMLNEMMGNMVDEEELEHHASSKFTEENLQTILMACDANFPESDCIELSRKLLKRLHSEANILRGVFHYYCKLAEKEEAVTVEEASSKQSSYLAGMETMDIDELSALMTAAKMLIPKIEQSYQEAFQATVLNMKSEGEGSHADLGMGYSHFEECMIRLAINICPFWAKDAEHKLSFVPEALNTICTHIGQNCDRLQHVEFGLDVRADNMQSVWSANAPELKEGYKLFCTSDNGSTMSLSDFLNFMKATKIAGARLSLPAMVDIFSCVQEEASAENSSETMDYQEFMEAMAACAVYMDPSPYLTLQHKVTEFLKATLLPGIEKAKHANKGRATSKKESDKRKKK